MRLMGAYITINVADDVEDGNYPIIIRNQEMAEVANISHKVTSTEAVITVQNPLAVLDKPSDEVEATDLSGLSNALYTTTLKAYRGKQVKVNIRMRNDEDITGFQTDILLPTGFTLAKDKKVNAIMEVGDRTNSSRHALNIAQQTDGSYRLIAMSAENKTFSGQDGIVATIVFDVAEKMKKGEYKVILRNQELAKPNNESIKPENITARLKVDIPGYFYDQINIEPYILYTRSVSVKHGERVDLSIGMANLNTICGFQADLILPEGVTVATTTDEFGDEVPLITYGSRTDATRHSINCVKQEDGSYRILCASTSNKTLTGNMGTVFTITLDVDATVKNKTYPVYIANQEFGEANNARHLMSVPYISRLFVRDKSPMFGDIFKDGKLTILDIQALQELLLHTDTEDYDEEAADTDNKGYISITDLVKLISTLKSLVK